MRAAFRASEITQIIFRFGVSLHIVFLSPCGALRGLDLGFAPYHSEPKNQESPAQNPNVFSGSIGGAQLISQTGE
jgi:hypothetical protein